MTHAQCLWRCYPPYLGDSNEQYPSTSLGHGLAAYRPRHGERGLTGPNLSANVALATDYTFRGLSQTAGHPAIQGGFDLSHSGSLYVGAWGSDVDFDDGDQASMELDYYGGYAWSYAAFGADVGIIYYSYPGAGGGLHYDYWEAYVKTSYRLDALSLDGGVDFSPDYFAGSGSAWHYHAGMTLPLAGPFSLSGSVGYQMIHANAHFGTPDYVDWKLAVSAA